MSIHKKNLKSLNIIHRALCVGSVAFLSTVLAAFALSTSSKIEEDITMGHIYAGIAAFMLIVQGILSHQLFKKGILEMPDNISLQDKIKHYRKLLIQSWALMESVQFFATIMFLITAHPALVVIWGIAFWMMITNSPGKQRLITNLGLTDKEVNELN